MAAAAAAATALRSNHSDLRMYNVISEEAAA